jgi:hypothetical protein
VAKRLGTCSECPEPLTHVTAKTCSTNCRSKRARRLKRQAKEQAEQKRLPEQQKTLSQAVSREVKDVIHEVAKEEIRPVIREAITEDVLRSIDKLVRLTPRLVDEIEKDLSHEDDAVRQRAYTLLAKYTLGNDSVKPAPKDTGQVPMQVIFAMPRPGDVPVEPSSAVSGTATEVEQRPCGECKELKTEFEGSSDRCTDCHEAVLAKVAHLRGDAPTS